MRLLDKLTMFQVNYCGVHSPFVYDVTIVGDWVFATGRFSLAGGMLNLMFV